MVPTTAFTLHSWNSADNGSTIENEEWLAFLQRNMEVNLNLLYVKRVKKHRSRIFECYLNDVCISGIIIRSVRLLKKH